MGKQKLKDMKVLFQDQYLTFYENGLIKANNLYHLHQKYDNGWCFKEKMNFHLSRPEAWAHCFHCEKEHKFYFYEGTPDETIYQFVGEGEWQEILKEKKRVKFELISPME